MEFDKDVDVAELPNGLWLILLGRFMEEHPEPKSYTDRQVDITREMLASAHIHDILEPVFRADSDWETIEERDQKVAHLSVGQRRLYAVWWYEAEVRNGGHDQYYSNSYGMFWQEALDGLEAIGAYTTKQILDESVARFTEQPSRHRKRRNDQLEGLKFHDLDTRLFAHPDNLDELMRKFILAHEGDFLFSGILRYENPPEFKLVFGKNGWRWERRTE